MLVLPGQVKDGASAEEEHSGNREPECKRRRTDDGRFLILFSVQLFLSFFSSCLIWNVFVSETRQLVKSHGQLQMMTN